MDSDFARADRISRARALAAPFVGLAVLSVQQWLFFRRDWAAVEPWQLVVWVVLAGAAFAVLMTGGSWLLPRRLRPLVDDESAARSRDRAIRGGFAAMTLTTLLVFIVSPIEPIDAQRAAHIIASLGLGVAFLVFGLEEVRALD